MEGKIQPHIVLEWYNINFLLHFIKQKSNLASFYMYHKLAEFYVSSFESQVRGGRSLYCPSGSKIKDRDLGQGYH
jgi:hypothetical protein